MQVRTERASIAAGAFEFPASVAPSAQRLQWRHTYDFVVKKVPCTIRFYNNSKADKCADNAEMAAYALSLVLRSSPKCPKIDAHVFLAECPKRLTPRVAGVLTEDEVNTGYARPCDTLVVYRRQEWLKVFLHECVHYLKLDDAFPDFPTATRLPPPFRIPHQVKLAEAFSETWARILNCRVVAHFSGVPVGALLKQERAHAVALMEKVLRSVGFAYDDLFTGRARQYREETNVIAYVVLTALLLQERKLDFDTTEGDVLEILVRRCRSPGFLALVRQAEDAPLQGVDMRMSAARLFSNE